MFQDDLWLNCYIFLLFSETDSEEYYEYEDDSEDVRSFISNGKNDFNFGISASPEKEREKKPDPKRKNGRDRKIVKNPGHPNSVLNQDLLPTSKIKPQPSHDLKVELAGQVPTFLEEPVNSYIIRGKSAKLTCSVSSAVKAYFTCNGEAMSVSPNHREVDLVTSGVVVKNLTLEVSRNQVEEFFGQFSCRCDAWSEKGMVSSRNVSVEQACKLFLSLHRFLECSPKFMLESSLGERWRAIQNEGQNEHIILPRPICIFYQ